jgi:hypothetical protein
MTETLAAKKCAPCRGGIPPLTHEEAERFQSQTPNWELRDDGHRIERTCRPINCIAARRNVLHLEGNDIAATQFAVDSEVEHG